MGLAGYTGLLTSHTHFENSAPYSFRHHAPAHAQSQPGQTTPPAPPLNTRAAPRQAAVGSSLCVCRLNHGEGGMKKGAGLVLLQPRMHLTHFPPYNTTQKGKTITLDV